MEVMTNKPNPFEIFSKELWVMIVDEVEDTKGIKSLFYVFPQLDISLDSKRKRFWYLDKVLSFVYEWVEDEDILNLRLVCKKWQAKVDVFLQNQPVFRAYSHNLHEDNQNFWGSKHIYKFWELAFDTDRFELEEVKKHPRSRNPFVFRYLLFAFQMAERNKIEGLLKLLFNLLKQWGHHLWYLDIRSEYYSNKFCALVSLPNPVWTLVKILQLTPNLKSLSLSGHEQNWNSKEFASLLPSDLPPLPFLETVSIPGWDELFSEEFLSIFMKRYGKQIRRLEVVLKKWEAELFKNDLPALTELQLRCVGASAWNKPEKGRLEIENLFSSFSAPNLVKIVLNSYEENSLRFSIEDDILKWLKLFPKIKYFEIYAVHHYTGKLKIEEKGTADPTVDSIPSLQCLKLIDGLSLSYNFLRCLPSLRDLTIRYRKEPDVVDQSMPKETVQLREQIQTGKVYESNIWEILRKLRTVKLLPQAAEYNPGDDVEMPPDKNKAFSFEREIYEKLKNAGKIPNHPQLYRLREDIVEFLQPGDFYRMDDFGWERDDLWGD